MSNAVKMIIAVVVVGVVVAAALLLGGKSADEGTKETNNKGSNAASSSSATITYDGGSFTPSEVTVKAGGSVTVVNESDTEVMPSSDNHPTHTVNPEINFGTIAPGDRETLTVDTAGDWKYHNHLSASQTGTIRVE